MFVFISGVDRTCNVKQNSIQISDELQERVNICKLTAFGFTPENYQEIKVYNGFNVRSATADSVTLEKKYNQAVQNNIFRIGSVITVSVNEANEETAVVSAISNDGGFLKLEVSANFTNQPAVESICGVKVFAGNISPISDKNIALLSNIEYVVTAYDYTKIFDKKNINDTYEDRDARYIINNFCNLFVNRNIEVDQLDYIDNSAIQAVWTNSGGGETAKTNDLDPFEADHWGLFKSTTGSLSTWTASLGSRNISEFIGTASGIPSKGMVGFWVKSNEIPTAAKIRLGNDTSNYIELDFTSDITGVDTEIYVTMDLSDATQTGAVDWTAFDYAAIQFSAGATITMNFAGIRFLEDEHFRHYPFVQSTSEIQDFRVPRRKPTETMQRLADSFAWFWYIDYDRNIHFFPQETNSAPFSLDEESNNFTNLSIKRDPSRLLNKQVVEGGDETSASRYSQVEEGDGFKREWITKNRFKNLVVSLDDNSSVGITEGGTNTTTIVLTGHGLSVDDYIVNRTRSNAVRRVLTVPDPNTFTVEEVASQTSGDTISFFVEQVVEVEGIGNESIANFMSNFNEKSIRNAANETTLESGEFLLFSYNEVFPIIVQRSDAVSVDAVKSILGHTDGVVDGKVIVDKTIKTRIEAITVADAQIKKYSNSVITATFSTTQEGLRTGQIIRIKDTDNGQRNIDQDFLIQKVKISQFEWGENVYSVTCSSSFYGIVELIQQLLRQGRQIEVEEDAIIDNIIDGNETVEIQEEVTIEKDPNKFEESVEITDQITLEKKSSTFKWQPDVINPLKWNLGQWS